jgi:hypothetical protein
MKLNPTTLPEISTISCNNKPQPTKLRSTPNYRDPRYYSRSQNIAPSTSIIPTPLSGLENKHRHHNLSSSSSKELDETQPENPNEWQHMGRVKRKRLLNIQITTQPSHSETSNRSDMLMEEASYPETSDQPKTPIIPKPPPTYVHGVINYKDMIKSITEVAEEGQFYIKTQANNVLKLSCLTPTTYRAIVKNIKEKNIFFHTYQLKEERAFRVMLKHLHYTTDTEDIKKELFDLWHVVRNITNIRHRQTKNR